MIKLFCLKLLRDFIGYVLPSACVIGIILGIRTLVRMLPPSQYATVSNVGIGVFGLLMIFGLIFLIVNYLQGVYTEVTSTIRRRNNKHSKPVLLDESYWFKTDKEE